MRWALLLLVLLSCLAPTVQAHAAAGPSFPVPRSTLDRMPGSVWMEFSEPLDRTATWIRVEDESGGRVDEGPTRVEGQRAEVRLRTDRTEGGFVVRWQTFSTIDGHRSAGTWAFAVGNASLPDVGLDPPRPLPWGEIFARFSILVGLALFLGALAWNAISPVTGPAWALEAGALLHFSAVLSLAAAQSAGYDAGLFAYLSQSSFGRGLLLRTLFAALLVAAAFATRSLRVPSRTYVLALAAAAVVAAHAVQSHAAARLPALMAGTLLDALHLLAACGWTGLLALHYLGSPKLTHDGSFVAVASRASRLSATSAVTLLATGPLLMAANLGFGVSAWKQGFQTQYGLILALKVLLALAMVSLGVLNHYAYMRPFARGERLERRNRFGLSVRREALLGVVLLFLGAAVTSLTPDPFADEADEAFFDAHEGTREVHAWIRPAPTANVSTTLLVEVAEADGSAAPGIEVNVTWVSPTGARSLHVLTPRGDLHELAGWVFDRGGEWRLEIRTGQDGFEEAVSFTVRVADCRGC